MISPTEAGKTGWETDFADRLLGWYDLGGRVLPWRKTRDPYRIWLSEIMLQQTGVETVIPYYEKFLARFPDMGSLAAADLDAVIQLWAGLGYYSRARNLHAAAVMVRDRFGGCLPDNADDLMSLPGIGRSTAGAILAIAFDRKAPLLDGNVRRILCRLLAVEDDPRKSSVEKILWRQAEVLTPEIRPHDYSQAIMDLGALICTPRLPACGRCPVAGCCRAHRMGRAGELPVRKKKKALPRRREVVLVVVQHGRLLLRKRPYGGMLGGLWEFPSLVPEKKEYPEEAAARLLAEIDAAGTLQPLGESRHTYSHFHLESKIFYDAAETKNSKVRENEQAWFSPAEMADVPVHGAHKKIFALVQKTGTPDFGWSEKEMDEIV